MFPELAGKHEGKRSPENARRPLAVTTNQPATSSPQFVPTLALPFPVCRPLTKTVSAQTQKQEYIQYLQYRFQETFKKTGISSSQHTCSESVEMMTDLAIKSKVQQM
jgi:hypothetical protein